MFELTPINPVPEPEDKRETTPEQWRDFLTIIPEGLAYGFWPEEDEKDVLAQKKAILVQMIDGQGEAIEEILNGT